MRPVACQRAIAQPQSLTAAHDAQAPPANCRSVPTDRVNMPSKSLEGSKVTDPHNSDAPNIDTPNIDGALFPGIDCDRLFTPARRDGPVRILMLYGSLRQRSFSRFAAEEAARILTRLGAEVRVFNPSGLPLVDDDVDATHPKVRELRDLVIWSDGMVWSSPERHGAMTGLMKTQIDWIPLSEGAVRPTQGKTLAVMQVSGGSQSFNAINQMRILGRWMRMVTIPNQSSIPKAFQQFDEAGRMHASPLYDRIVDVMEELMKFTLLLRDRSDYLVDRYSERKERGAAMIARVNRTGAL